MIKISIDQKECVGCSLCESLVPELFKLDEKELKGKLKDNGNLVYEMSAELSAEQLEKVKETASSCPAQAIKIEEI